MELHGSCGTAVHACESEVQDGCSWGVQAHRLRLPLGCDAAAQGCQAAAGRGGQGEAPAHAQPAEELLAELQAMQALRRQVGHKGTAARPRVMA